MMLHIAGYEFNYQLRSFATLASFIVLLGLGFLFTANGGEFQSFAQGGVVNANAPYTITKILLVMSVLSVFLAPPYIAGAVLKDSESRFDAILFSLPISKKAYLMGRFMGGAAALLLVFAGAPLGLLLGTYWPWADPTLLGPTQFTHYLVVYFGLVTPSILAVSALVFAMAVASRSLIYTYLMALGLLIVYLVTSGSDILPAVLDPFLYKVFEAQVEYWTAAERNTQLIHYDHVVIASRIIWSVVAALCLLLAYRWFELQPASVGPGKKYRINKAQTVNRNAQPLPDSVAQVIIPAWTARVPFYQFLWRTRFELLAVVRSWPFLILMVISLFMLVTTLLGRDLYYGVAAYPLTRLMVDGLSSLIMALMGVLVFYSADIIWREREAGFNEIIDATPVPNWVFVVSKLIALGFVMVSILVLGVVIAIAIQTFSGYFRYELSLYLERGLFYLLLPYLCLAVLTCFFQVLSKNRYLGMLLFGLFIGVIASAVDLFGVEHPLFSYGLPGRYAPLSDMNGTGRFMAAGYWLRVYWGAVAGLLLMSIYLLWNRGTLQPVKYRLRALRQMRAPRFVVPAVLLGLIVIVSGTYIFYNTNVLNEYRTKHEVYALQARYEKTYSQYRDLPMPRTTAIYNAVDIFPYRRRVENQSTHIVTNQSDKEISTVHIIFPSVATVSYVNLEDAILQKLDEELSYYIFTLNSPMRPGESRKLEFNIVIQQRGFPHDEPDVTLVRNGSFFDNNRIAPHIGFEPEMMIEDQRIRRQYGLPQLPQTPRLEDHEEYKNNAGRQDSDFIDFETTVSTVLGQIAIAPGRLVRDWVQDDRRYFSYKMSAPIRNFYSYLSAEYEVARDQWHDVTIEIFHHGDHTYNLSRMFQGVKDSLDYFTAIYSPYQYGQVRIVEFPAYRQFAQSFPNTIPYSEGMGFVANPTAADIDMPYYVTVHEMAHQWWGHQVTAANTQGDGFIHETLAQYSALLVMEKTYGKHQVRQFLKYELDHYLEGRADDPAGELPLYRVESQPYIFYRKGAVVMYALRDYLGEATINRALKRLIELRAYSADPYATTLDFLELLKAEAEPQHIPLIEDFLEKITLYDLKMVGGRVVKLADGRFEVSLTVDALKYYADATGHQTQARFDTPVDIGLFLKSPTDSDFSADDVITLEKYPVADGRSTITLVVAHEPLMAGIDPYNKLIDRISDDNLTVVTKQRTH